MRLNEIWLSTPGLCRDLVESVTATPPTLSRAECRLPEEGMPITQSAQHAAHTRYVPAGGVMLCRAVNVVVPTATGPGELDIWEAPENGLKLIRSTKRYRCPIQGSGSRTAC